MQRFRWALVLLAVLWPWAAGATEFDQSMNTLWEVLWHQSGTPTRVVRWENDIRVWIYGLNAKAERQHILQALQTVTHEAGIKLLDVSNQPDAAQSANLRVEITPNTMLTDNQPCATYLDFSTETKIESAVVQMRAHDAHRCAYHEAMHVMGARGHPSGKTVLSYSSDKVDGLLPLDKVILHAWYSPHMTAGMTPFEALPVLADELIAAMPDQAGAAQQRDQFFADTVEQMRAYADGRGGVPTVLKSSGKTTAEGIRFGRSEMSYFLGIAYMEGATVGRDTDQAVHWLQRAAVMGNRGARAKLGTVQHGPINKENSSRASGF